MPDSQLLRTGQLALNGEISNTKFTRIKPGAAKGQLS